MLKRFAVATAFAGLCAAGAADAQTPASGSQSQDPAHGRQPEQQESRPAMQAGTTTLTGCVYRENQIAGRSPNVVEQAGVLEDYILADVKTSGAESAQAQPGSEGAVGTSGVKASMYKLEHADDDRLRALVGKRVEVTGKIDAEPGDRGHAAHGAPAGTAPTGTAGATEPRDSDRSLGPDQINLPEFEITSIREVAGGNCPPSPQAGSER